MGKTKDFLDTLSDHELAFFAKYKQHTYMRDTQEDIKNYILERNLTQKAIDQFIAQPTQLYYENAECCSRCGTDKLLINNVQWTQTHQKHNYGNEFIFKDSLYNGDVIYKDEIICNVCDFWLEDPNNQNPKKKRKRTWIIWDLFMSAFD
ncbi:MAG: hypothetical protein ABI554_10645 [Flavobacterium sp.]